MANKKKILVVDDEDAILELLSYHLQKEGFRPLTAKTGEEALEIARSQLPELILLDLMLPYIQGLDVAKILRAREETRHIPIIMLTAKSEEADMVVGLEIGADDYVTKPFSPRVLIARIKAVLRRKETESSSDVIKIRDLTIYPQRHEVYWRDEIINLTKTEFKILVELAKRPNRVFSRYQIVDIVHGEDYAVTERSVDVAISSLRKKLGEAGSLLETVRGVGYKLRLFDDLDKT